LILRVLNCQDKHIALWDIGSSALLRPDAIHPGFWCHLLVVVQF